MLLFLGSALEPTALQAPPAGIALSGRVSIAL